MKKNTTARGINRNLAGYDERSAVIGQKLNDPAEGQGDRIAEEVMRLLRERLKKEQPAS